MPEVDKEMKLIADKVKAVKESGFGEVRILIKNGTIYRIMATEDELVKES